MKPFTHFLTPEGRGSVVEEGPWHYGIDYVSVYFRGDVECLQRLLPRPLRVVDGTAVAYVSEFVSVSEKNPEASFLDPAQTIYHEAGVGVLCEYKGRRGIFYPFMWVDKDWALIRGWLNGYPKKIADEIVMTRFHRFNRFAEAAGEGVRLTGYCARHGYRLLTVRLKINRRGAVDDIMKFGATFGYRHFPTTHESQTAVSEIVEVIKTNSRADDVWVGEGEIELGKSPSEELELVKPLEVIYGIHYKAGFVIEGAKVLERY